MSANVRADHLTAVVRYALDTTRATIICPFHDEVIIRVAMTPRRAMPSNALRESSEAMEGRGKEIFREEFGRQLGAAADAYCPRCNRIDPDAGRPGRWI